MELLYILFTFSKRRGAFLPSFQKGRMAQRSNSITGFLNLFSAIACSASLIGKLLMLLTNSSNCLSEASGLCGLHLEIIFSITAWYNIRYGKSTAYYNSYSSLFWGSFIFPQQKTF